MNTFTKRSIVHLVGMLLIAIGCIVYWQVRGRLPPVEILIPLLGVPVFLGFACINPKRGPEFDERDRTVMLRSNLIGLAVSWTIVTLGLTAIGRYEELVSGEHLTYTFPIGIFLLFLAREFSVLYSNRSGLGL